MTISTFQQRLTPTSPYNQLRIMATKYHGLPDIVSIGHRYSRRSWLSMQDTAPDVFETIDEPGRVLVPVSTQARASGRMTSLETEPS